jgi:biotin transporter BioY
VLKGIRAGLPVRQKAQEGGLRIFLGISGGFLLLRLLLISSRQFLNQPAAPM